MKQSDFTAALLDPDLPVPPGLTDPQGRPAGKRFNVYRNNVVVSLAEALETAFPVIRKLVGDEFFAAMAREFLRAHPPASPVMMFYGDEMPGFLASFPPVAHLGYLADVARLELAMRQSYHAADATAMDPAVLRSLPAERLMAARLHLAPAVRVLASDWPIHAIWRANMVEGAPKPRMQAEEVLVARPSLDPQIHALPRGGAAFVQALLQQSSFAQALEAAGEDFDLTAALSALLAAGAITGIDEGTDNERIDSTA